MKRNINQNFPKLNFMNFFNGKVEAKGHLIQYYPRKKIKNLHILFAGNIINKNKIVIKEFYKEDNINLEREWIFEKINDNNYLGKENSVVGNIKVSCRNNYLNMNYLFKIMFWKHGLNVKVVDDMYLINDKEIINSTLISKFKINLAHSFLLYKKL